MIEHELTFDFDEILNFLEEEVEGMELNDGEIPSRAAEIKAKKKKKATATERLDVDTRIPTSDESPNVKNCDQEIV